MVGPAADASVLAAHRVAGPPPHDLSDLFLVEGYVTEDEEERLVRQIAAQRAAWVQLSGRRLQNHGGTVTQKGFLVPAPLPDWLSRLAVRVDKDVPPLREAGGANHVLINSYLPGEGIMPHSDGPVYAPTVAILSLGSPCVIRFWRKQEEAGTGGQPPRASLALPRRSMLVFVGDAYEHCLHGIEETAEERLDASVVNRDAPWVKAAAAAAADATAAGGGDAAAEDGGGSNVADMGRPESSGRAASAEGEEAAANGGGAEALVLPRTGERLSLTIRRVLKVHKGLRLPGAVR